MIWNHDKRQALPPLKIRLVALVMFCPERGLKERKKGFSLHLCNSIEMGEILDTQASFPFIPIFYGIGLLFRSLPACLSSAAPPTH